MIRYFGTPSAYGEDCNPMPATAMLNVTYSDGSVIDETRAEMTANANAEPYPVGYVQIAVMKVAA